MNKIEQTYDIAASPAQVWRALTDPKIIEEWSGADAVFSLHAGADYSLWDGSIGGKILAVVPRKKLTQSWKPDNWEREDSVVTFMLTPTGTGTRVTLLHENVEEWDYDGTREGWDIYYLGAIKRMLDAKPAKKAKAVKGKTTSKQKPVSKTASKKKTGKKTATRSRKHAS
ncbi:hypothetical protein ANRL3_01144 [Anaerolineae bacterium]|nr:hypothetical protein ANRL3_01144 [Anaerolineae bacterium]